MTEARAAAQRAKLESQAEARTRAPEQTSLQTSGSKPSRGKKDQAKLLANRRAGITVERAIEDYLLDREGGNHSLKTLQGHQTALGLLKSSLEQERSITLIGEVDAPDITAC